MSRRAPLIAFVVFWILAFGIGFSCILRAQDTPVVCTARGWYQRTGDNLWAFVNPSKSGTCTQAGTGAHTMSCYYPDGALYQILDQCHEEQHCTGTTGTYKKPDGGSIPNGWECYYTTPCPNSSGDPVDPELRRHLFGYWNDAFVVPNGSQHYTFHTLAEIPEPQRTMIGRANGCEVGPTPTYTSPTPRPTGGAPTRTPTRLPTVDPCGPVPNCKSPTPPPFRTSTRTPTRTPSPAPSGFTLAADWTKSDGSSGHATLIPYTPTTTLAWFFSADNIELIVKVLDGCAVNGSRWVFAGGLTNVAVTLTVRENATGAVKVYRNPQGIAFAPIQDTAAFGCH